MIRASQIIFYVLILDLVCLCVVMFIGFINLIPTYAFAASAAILVVSAVQTWIIAKVVEIFEDSNNALQRIADRLDSQTR